MSVVSEGYRAISQVFETDYYSSNHLFISDFLFSSLASVYPLVGQDTPKDVIDVKVHLMYNKNPIRRMMKYPFEAQKSDIARQIEKDPLLGYYEKSISLLNSDIMDKLDLESGELIAIHAMVPGVSSLEEL